MESADSDQLEKLRAFINLINVTELEQDQLIERLKVTPINELTIYNSYMGLHEKKIKAKGNKATDTEREIMEGIQIIKEPIQEILYGKTKRKNFFMPTSSKKPRTRSNRKEEEAERSRQEKEKEQEAPNSVTTVNQETTNAEKRHRDGPQELEGRDDNRRLSNAKKTTKVTKVAARSDILTEPKLALNCGSPEKINMNNKNLYTTRIERIETLESEQDCQNGTMTEEVVMNNRKRESPKKLELEDEDQNEKHDKPMQEEQIVMTRKECQSEREIERTTKYNYNRENLRELYGSANMTNVYQKTGDRNKRKRSREMSNEIAIYNEQSAKKNRDLQRNTERKREIAEVAARTYNITTPRNINNDGGEEKRSSHIKNWESVNHRGYSIEISGKDYKKGLFQEMIAKARDEINYKSVKPLPNGVTVITRTEEDRALIKREFEKMKLNLKITVFKYRLPIIKFWLQKQEEDINLSPEQLIEKIKQINFKKHSDKPFTLFRLFKQDRKEMFIAANVHADIRTYIERERDGKILYGDETYKVVDHFTFRRCFTCGQTNHTKCQKGTEQRCLRCTGWHHKKHCDENKYPEKCLTCKGPHQTYSLDCPITKNQIDQEMNDVDYTYRTILYARGF